MPQAETSADAGQKSVINIVLSAQEVKTAADAGKKTDNNKVLPLQEAETLAGSGEKANQLKMDNNAGDIKILSPPSCPKTVKKHCIQCLANNQERARCLEEKFKKVANVNDAVELSISASETLAIHEIVKSESASEDFPTAAVLEAALQVKKARLNNQEDVSNYPNEEIDETHLLLDLDDLTMAGACKDVGLSSAGSDEKCVSGSKSFIIKDTSLSENYNVSNDNGFKHVEVLAHQKKLPVDPALDLNSSYLAGRIDPMLHQSTQETSHVLAAAQVKSPIFY